MKGMFPEEPEVFVGVLEVGARAGPPKQAAGSRR